MNRNYGDVTSGCRKNKINIVITLGGKEVTVLKYAYTLEEQNILDIRCVLDGDLDRYIGLQPRKRQFPHWIKIFQMSWIFSYEISLLIMLF